MELSCGGVIVSDVGVSATLVLSGTGAVWLESEAGGGGGGGG